MDTQNKFIELKDICDKVFKRNSIYPLMEIPKPDSKDTIEEALNNIYLKSMKAKEEIVSEWINDVNVRIEAGKRYGDEETKRYIRTMENK